MACQEIYFTSTVEYWTNTLKEPDMEIKFSVSVYQRSET